MTAGRKSVAPAASVPQRWDAFKPIEMTVHPGITLIEASAGTGKTFNLINSVLRLILDHHATDDSGVTDISRILVVTFTVAATDELITKMRARLRDAVEVFASPAGSVSDDPFLLALRRKYGSAGLSPLRQALARVDRLSIFTIHGFCKRVLEDNALESGTPYSVKFIEDDAELMRAVAHDWWRRTLYDDALLAALAVDLEWTPEALINDLRNWRRYPGTQVIPAANVGDATRAVERALEGACETWHSERVPALLERLKWRKGGPLSTPHMRAQLPRVMATLARRDRCGAARMLAHCTTDAILDKKKGIWSTPAAAHDDVRAEPFFAACADVASAIDDLRIAVQTTFILGTDRAFEAEKRRRQVLAFDDLLRRVHDGLFDPRTGGQLAGAIRARYNVALIDEFQDTDALQYPIFSEAFKGRPLFLIGDPKQSIYGFRGADVYLYMRAVREARTRFTLSTNYRATPRLVAALNNLFGGVTRPFLYDVRKLGYVSVSSDSKEPDPVERSAPAFCWWLMVGERNKLPSVDDAHERFHEEVVDEIVRLLEGRAKGVRKLLPREIAVLVRTNREARALQRAMSEAGVPSVLRGSGDILDSEEMTELAQILAAVTRPADQRAVRGALATVLWGMDASEFHAMAHAPKEHEWQNIMDRLAESRDRWSRHGFLRMVHSLLDQLGVAERLLLFRDGDRRLTNLRHAIEVLHSAEQSDRLSPEGLLVWLAQTRGTTATDAERRELRLESDAEAVQLSTIHLSKGLEYGVVFCTSLWHSPREREGPVLARQEDDSVVYDLGSEELERNSGLAAAETLAEELRLTYVALTRAKFRCYVGLAVTREASARSPLGYLLLNEPVDPEPRHTLVKRVRDKVTAAMPTWESRLKSMCEDKNSHMSVRVLPEVARGLRFAPNAKPQTPAPARSVTLAPNQLDTWRFSSYTRLSRRAASHNETHADDPEIGGHEIDEAAVAEAADTQDSGFMAFPKGRDAGIVLHSIFQELDFASPETEELSALVSRHLRDSTLRLANHDAACGDVCKMLLAVLRSPLPDADFQLRNVARDAIRREWRFLLPLAHVTREALIAPFRNASSDPARAYARYLAGLDAFDVHGFLTGSVDLLFQHHGRWHLVDWKSNYLGGTRSCYEHRELERTMFAEHYTLQYHLYVLALHRFLRSRIRDYDYDRDIGGVWYAFLRGVDGDSSRGWYHDRPPRALIDALDAALLDAALLGTAPA